MIQLKAGGTNRWHPRGFTRIYRREKSLYTFLLAQGKCSMKINGVTYPVTENMAVLIDGKTECSYITDNGEYSDHWIQFEATEKEIKKYNLKINELFLVNNPKRLESLIQQALYEVENASEECKAANMAAIIVLFLNNIRDAEKNVPEKFQELRMQVYNDPVKNWTVTNSAAVFELSESRFMHLYSQYFGISFVKELIKAKIKYSCMLLETTELSVDEIAEMCGYANKIHFHRQFKAETGTTPAIYRNR